MMQNLFYTFFAQTQPNPGALNWLTQKFIEGGFFMYPILLFFIIGLAISFERLYTLSRARINAAQFVNKIQNVLKDQGVEAAKEVCKNTRGPVASIFYAGLLRYDEGLDSVEKAIIAYGGVEMGFLERGLVWLSLSISMAPLLGFTGTVQGMILAFDAIKEANQISPSIVAGGISVALLTTLFGLVVAMVLQVFYNLFVTKIDRIVADMEEGAIRLVDTLYEIKSAKKAGGDSAKLPR